MSKILNKLKDFYEKYKYAIFSSVIFTFITHLYYFSSRFGNEDDINFVNFGSRTLSSGRWTTGTFFSGATQIPMVKFLLAIVVLVLVTVLICDMFKIKEKKHMIILSLILSTFPSLAMSFSYLFMTEIYMLALLSAVAAIYFTVKFKYGFILGSLFIGFSLGNYQSYIGVASGLAIIYLIRMILKKYELKDIIKMFLKLLLMGLGGILVYFIILKVYLNIFDVSLSTYKGADSMGIPPLNMWGTLLIRTYKHFIGYFLGVSVYKSSIFFTLVRVILIGIFFFVIFKKLQKNDFKNWWLLLICLALTPLAINIVDFVVYKAEIGVLNVYQFVLLYVLIIVSIQELLTKDTKCKNIILTLSTICFVIISYQNYTLTNKYYIKMEEFYEYTESLTNRLVMRMELVDGFNYDMPVMFVGDTTSDFYDLLIDTEKWNNIVNFDQGLWGRFIGFEDIYYFENEQKILDFIENRHGIVLNRVDEDVRKEIKETHSIEELEDYPSKNSMKIINGILVVKF